MTYFLGVDVGATKTHALIMDSMGRVCALGEAGTGNPEIIGYDGLARVLMKCCGEAIAKAGINTQQIVSAAFGIAGYDWPMQLADMYTAIQGLGLTGNIRIVNDALLGLVAGAPEGWGIVASAGTGNNVWGIDRDGNEGHITGNSSRYGEYGGASELVAEAVKQVAYMWTQRGPKTALADLFLGITSAPDLTTFLGGLVENRYHLAAEHASLVIKTARDGDAVARQVVAWSANELALSVLAVARQLNLVNQPFSLVLSGGLFRHNPDYSRIFEDQVHQLLPLANLTALNADPVFGAVLLAKQGYDGVTSTLREVLFSQVGTLKGICDEARND